MLNAALDNLPHKFIFSVLVNSFHFARDPIGKKINTSICCHLHSVLAAHVFRTAAIKQINSQQYDLIGFFWYGKCFSQVVSNSLKALLLNPT